MKKLILAAVLILSMALISYGKPANKDNGLLKGLTTALKNSQGTSTVTTAQYRKTSFYFNGKTVNAYYDPENDELIGFAIPMSVADLPKDAIENIKTKFNGYSIDTMVMFIQESGFFGFYVSMSRSKAPTIVVSINAKGKAHYYGKMQARLI